MGGSKSAKGGPNPLADMDRGGGGQIPCDTGFLQIGSHTDERIPRKRL